MKTTSRIPSNYIDRMENILDLSWRLLKERFIDERQDITKEAPFQHYFANIISTIGELYCTKKDQFFVDLETKCKGIKGKNKYLDITCHFPQQKVSCAIELKFKTATQAAQDHGRIDAYVDIEALEIVCKDKFNIGKFYMITDSKTYLNKSKIGVGTEFCMHDGAETEMNKTFHCPNSKGRENVIVHLEDTYRFDWEEIRGWYFLEISLGNN